MHPGIRLVNGGNVSEGRVELYINGQWGTVCDDAWDLMDANVVCRQLGFGGATAAWQSARFGQGTGPIWLDEVGCADNESSILDCPRDGLVIGQHNCGDGEDASVSCWMAMVCSPPTVRVYALDGPPFVITDQALEPGQCGETCIAPDLLQTLNTMFPGAAVEGGCGDAPGNYDEFVVRQDFDSGVGIILDVSFQPGRMSPVLALSRRYLCSRPVWLAGCSLSSSIHTT